MQLPNGPDIYTTFRFTCTTCGDTVQVTDGRKEPHPCPESPVVVISGCDRWAAEMRERFDDQAAQPAPTGEARDA